MRKIIISLIGLLIIAGGFFGMKKLGSRERPQRPKETKALPTVFTQAVKNGSIPLTITASGNVAAKNRIEIYAEVQGVFTYSSRAFKAGTYYKKGDVLLRLNSDEAKASLRAQKSALYNQLVAILPDLRFDYADVYEKWKDYVSNFDVQKPLLALPEMENEKEKLFIAGRNITSTWFTAKNLEERLRKYVVYAPFSGILTEANIDKGALVRSGQKLGEFISPAIYELEVAVNASYADYLKVRSTVDAFNIDRSKTYKGKVSRINSLVDPGTQTVQAFIRVDGSGLREGMYLEADLVAEQIPDAYELSRKLLVDDNKLYQLKGDVIMLTEVEIVHFTEKTVIVKGLADGSVILSKPLPGAYDNMTVKVFEEK